MKLLALTFALVAPLVVLAAASPAAEAEAGGNASYKPCPNVKDYPKGGASCARRFYPLREPCRCPGNKMVSYMSLNKNNSISLINIKRTQKEKISHALALPLIFLFSSFIFLFAVYSIPPPRLY
jgi:hypothetical protein